MKILRKIFATLMILLSPVSAFAQTEDQEAIKQIVTSVASLADAGNFEALEKLYAPLIELDYTSLSGGEVEQKSPRELMTEWASVLPGFDRTYHAISNIEVSIENNEATATADVTADHSVDNLFWQVKGSYIYRLQKTGNNWQITAHTFIVEEESGTRDVFGPAIENARANPVSYLRQQESSQSVD